MKWIPMRGRCSMCGRMRASNKPVLKRKFLKSQNVHIMVCSVCSSEWIAATEEDIIRQKGER